MDAVAKREVRAAVAAIRDALGDNAKAVYLYGSAVTGGLKPASDLDLFVVLERPTGEMERARLFDALTPLSAKRVRPADWRPLEVTGAVHAALDPLGDPPVTDFQFGEWLRDRMDSGRTEPEAPHNPDLALLVAMVRGSGRALYGPEPNALISAVEAGRLRRTLLAVVPDLMSDLSTDTANVLLTLARVAYTLRTGSFAPKDVAANWVLARLEPAARPGLEQARAVHLGEQPDRWDGLEDGVRLSASALEEMVRGHGRL